MKAGQRGFASSMLAVALCGSLAFVWTGCKPKQEGAAPGGQAKPAEVAVTPGGEAPVQPAAAPVDPATVLVEVDGAKLTAGQVEEQVKRMMANNPNQVSADRVATLMPRLRQQAAEQFVVRTLLRNEVAKEKITVTEDDLKKATGEITARLPPGVTIEDAMKKDGVSAEQFRTNLIEELKVKKLVEAHVPTNVAPTAEDIAQFYESQKERFAQPESVEARHILIKVDETEKDDVRAGKKAKAEALRKQLAEGADFEKLAQENSDCPSKERGGSLGSFSRGQMVKPFEDAAFSQATNAIGPVVETQFGYHIIQVTGHTAPKTTSLDEVKERITDYLKQRKQYEAFETYLTGLKAKAKIAYPGSAAMAEPNPMPEALPQQGQ